MGIYFCQNKNNFLLFKVTIKSFGLTIKKYDQLFGPLPNFGSDNTAWKVDKEFLALIEICLHSYFLESRWNELFIYVLSLLPCKVMFNLAVCHFDIHFLNWQILRCRYIFLQVKYFWPLLVSATMQQWDGIISYFV